MTALAADTKIPPRARLFRWLPIREKAFSSAREQKPLAFVPERRREVRYPTCEAVKVAALDVPGLQVQGVLRDVSRNGLCVELGLPVDSGARLRILLGDQTTIVAAVCYCRKTSSSYHVGAVIKGVYQATHLKAEAPRKVHCNIWRVDPGTTVDSGDTARNGELAHAIVSDTLWSTSR